jgi:hypothetical protein
LLWPTAPPADRQNPGIDAASDRAYIAAKPAGASGISTAAGINLFLFLAPNGYLLGREYFEVVALRRLDAAARGSVPPLRSAGLPRGFDWGLLAVPVVNLVAPLIATAFMLHVFEALRHADPHPLTRSAL